MRFITKPTAMTDVKVKLTQNIAHIFAHSGRSLGKLRSKLRPKLRPPEVARQDKTKDRGGGLVTLDYHSSEQAICDKHSWAVHARPSSGIYLELTGALLP